jgi:hypothetical protein
MRVVFGFVLALCVGVAACFGSAQVANSAQANGRIVTLKLGDVAVLGDIQCRVFTRSPGHPVEYAHVQCSNGPLSKAVYSFATARGIQVFQKGVSAPIYSSPIDTFGHLQVPNSWKATRIVRLRVGDVAIVPDGHYPVRVQCRAVSRAYLRCSSGPLSKAPYYAGITNAGINVYKKGSSAPIYSTPPAATSG